MNKTLIFLCFLIFTAFPFFGQELKKSFPIAVAENIKLYNIYSSIAYERGNIEKGNYFFDTLVSNQLAGTKFQDYTLKKIYGGKLKLSAIKKPIIIQTYAAWCVLNKGEAAALNKLASKYAKKAQIIVLFWNKKQDAKNIASQFNGNIEVCYAYESYGRDEPIIATMKYAIGYLTSYYLDQNLIVIDIKKGTAAPLPPKTPMKDCIKYNFDINEKHLLDLLEKSNLSSSTLTKKMN